MADHLVDKAGPPDTPKPRSTRLKPQTALAGLTADDIAAIWNIPKGTVYRYAHKYQWRRYTDTGRAYYHPDDVSAALENLVTDEH